MAEPEDDAAQLAGMKSVLKVAMPVALLLGCAFPVLLGVDQADTEVTGSERAFRAYEAYSHSHPAGAPAAEPARELPLPSVEAGRPLEPSPPPLPLPPLPDGAPPSSVVSLVDCDTTTGRLHIAVYDGWAPRGGRHFLDLVRSGFYSSKVALFRNKPNWIVQFGISGDPAITKPVRWLFVSTSGNGCLLGASANTASSQRRLARTLLSVWRSRLWREPIEDDRQWLPAEPRRNRFKRGMLAYAGGGPNTRRVGLIVAKADISIGKAPWEVPFGRLLGAESLRTMDGWWCGPAGSPASVCTISSLVSRHAARPMCACALSAAWYEGYGDMQRFGGKAPDQTEM